MRAATNQVGFAVERFDGAVVGWTAITQPFSTREWATAALSVIERTPGAEYRVMPALKVKTLKAAAFFAAIFCTSCAPDVQPAQYTCSTAQREVAQAEAMRETELVNAWDAWARRSIYETALARNCAVKP